LIEIKRDQIKHRFAVVSIVFDHPKAHIKHVANAGLTGPWAMGCLTIE
jgi:hypothetical protein